MVCVRSSFDVDSLTSAASTLHGGDGLSMMAGMWISLSSGREYSRGISLVVLLLFRSQCRRVSL